MNNRQGLGFSANGAVLDKKRIRVMITAVAGIFIVPFLLALYSASSDAAPIYGRMANSTRIFAFSAKPRSYEASVAYCETLWMQTVSIHSEAERDALVELSEFQNGCTWIGADRDLDDAGWAAGVDASGWTWDDGSKFDYYTKWNLQGRSAGQTRMCQKYDSSGLDWEHYPDDSGHPRLLRGAVASVDRKRYAGHDPTGGRRFAEEDAGRGADV